MLVNLLHLCETMTKSYVSEAEIRVPMKVFKKFAERNHFSIDIRVKNNRPRYRLIRKEIPVFFISGEEEKEFKFLDLADLHIGHKKFDEEALRKRLEITKKQGIKRVFIAGDLFEGCCNSCESKYLAQIDLAYSIFKDYPFDYYVINGNHDYSFEQAGFENPIKRVSKMLKSEGINFNYFDCYLMDFVICGVIKRVMHIEKYDFNKRRIAPILKLKSFEENGMLENYCCGKFYPVRFFQVGHIHVNVQMYYAKKKIYISQSGSFVDHEAFDDLGNVIQGTVLDQKVFMN